MSGYAVKPCPYALDGVLYRDCPRDVHGLEGERCSDCPAKSAMDAAGPFVTKSGRVLTDEDIQRLADEAERGYDVAEILARRDATVDPLGHQYRLGYQDGFAQAIIAVLEFLDDLDSPDERIACHLIEVRELVKERFR